MRRARSRLKRRQAVYLNQEELELLETILGEYGDEDDLDALYTPAYGELQRKTRAALSLLILDLQRLDAEEN